MSSASNRTVLVQVEGATGYRRMNTTGSSVKPEIQRIESRIVRTRRDVQDNVVVTRAAGGTLPSELHFPIQTGTVDGTTVAPPSIDTLDLAGALFTLFKSALQTEDVDAVDQEYDTASVTASTITVPSTAAWQIGDIIQLVDTGPATPEVRGYYRVTAINTATDATLDLRGDTLAAVTNYRRGARLRNGANQEPHTVVIQDRLATERYETFTGMHVNTMALRIADGEISTIEFGMLGTDSLGMQDAATPPADDTQDRLAPASQVYNSKGHVPVLYVTTPTATAVLELKEWSMDLNNGMEARTVIGQLAAISIRSGTLRVNGTMKGYLDAATEELYNSAINDEEASALYVAEDSNGLAIAISLPRVKFSDQSRESTGQDTDIFVDLQYSTLADAGEDGSIRIQFFDMRVT